MGALGAEEGGERASVKMACQDGSCYESIVRASLMFHFFSRLSLDSVGSLFTISSAPTQGPPKRASQGFQPQGPIDVEKESER